MGIHIYNLEDLKREWNRGEKFKFLFFWGAEPSADGRITETCLSQWWICPFTVEGVTYTCAEQYMMAEKTRLFHDTERLENIMKAKHPKEMKAFGRAVRNFDETTWENNCRDIVRRGNIAKFSQNPELLEFLMRTENKILVEASPMDRIWGIGLGKANPNAECPDKWRGTNFLGFTLMEVRDLLIEQKGREE